MRKILLLVGTFVGVFNASCDGQLDTTKKVLSGFRAYGGYECAFHLRKSTPEGLGYFFAAELSPIGRNFNICVGLGFSKSNYNDDLFGYSYSWKMRYRYAGAGIDYQLPICKNFVIRQSSMIYWRYIQYKLQAENDVLVNYLEEPYQRPISIGLSLAAEWAPFSGLRFYIEAGYQIPLVGAG